MKVLVLGTALVLGSGLGCTESGWVGDGGDGGDAGQRDADPEDAGFHAEAPIPAERPRTTPCPESWREVVDPDDPELAACDPWPEGGPLDCAEDEAHFPGGPRCERIGTACPAGDWAQDIPQEESVLYVLLGAGPGGVGTAGLPFGSIREALDSAEDGTIIAISKGTFDETVTLRSPVTLWGACVAETTVRSSTWSGTEGVINFQGRGGATVKNLSVTGGRYGAVADGNATAGRLESVLVQSATAVGILADRGGRLTGVEIVVRDTTHRGGDFGFGLQIAGGSEVELDRAVLERNRVAGIAALGSETNLRATDTVVRDTLPSALDDDFGFGLQLLEGARAELLRVALERNRTGGLFVADSGTDLAATDVVVRDTQPSGFDDAFGRGLDVGSGARVSVNRGSFERNHDIGVRVTGAQTELLASDLIVRGTLSRASDETGGFGLQVDSGARVQIERTVFARNRTNGVVVAGVSTTVVARDLAIRDTLPREVDDDWGLGLVVRDGAQVEIERAALERNRAIGVFIAGIESRLTAADVAVQGMLSLASDGTMGEGLIVFDFATVILRRASFRRSRGIGVAAVGDAALTAEDLVVEGTIVQDCVEGGCPEEAWADGILAADDATIEATRLISSDNHRCGVQPATGGTADLHEGEISHNPIGVNVQTEGFDLTRLQDRVVYIDNDLDLDSGLLPVPEPTAGLDL